MKGQVPLISYTMAFLLGVILIVFFSMMFFSFYSNFLKNEIKNELENLAIKLSNSIIKFYEFAKNSNFLPKNSSCVLIGEESLEFPSKISNRNYEITVKSYEQGFLIIATTQEPLETVEKELPNIQVDFQGKIENGKNAELRYLRCNLNNAIKDKIIIGKMGEFDANSD